MNKIRQFANSLLLPITLLPLAGILLRIWQPDLLNIKFVENAGNVIFINFIIFYCYIKKFNIATIGR
jgi:phosphotransferase system  glucose/maltose/N-acetylglucosamine-specific IIC component